ncbi:MAG: hypothetical protein GDA44_04855 [Prochloron sp. SP5CPC1]|nr:hypothetical protein [Candidatus Paraprochloron terpiosi SP5CPC1]
MSKILCPFCFEQFKSSQTLFRCINSRCSGQAPDKTYAKYQGLLSAPKLGLSFAPREGGIKKIAGLFQGPREVSCPTCQRPTPKRICPTCHYELMYDAGRTKERTIAVIGGRSAGKSIYITTLIHCLFNQVGTNFNAGVMARGDLTWNCYQNDFYKPLYEEGRLLLPIQTAEVNARTKTPMVFSGDY